MNNGEHFWCLPQKNILEYHRKGHAWTSLLFCSGGEYLSVAQ